MTHQINSISAPRLNGTVNSEISFAANREDSQFHYGDILEWREFYFSSWWAGRGGEQLLDIALSLLEKLCLVSFSGQLFLIFSF
jgi:hypothetical protein